MADQKITDLATGTTVDAADWLVYVDVSDTSMDPTGTDKKVAPAILSAALAITTSQISNLSSWAGSTALTTLGTIATGTWQGTAINKTYLDATLVNTAGTYANPAWITSIASTKITGTITTAQIGAAQVTYASIQNVAASSLLGNSTGSPAAPAEITLGPNLGFIGTTIRGRKPILWVISPGTAVANTTTSTSIFTGATLGGSRTIPANTFQVGSMLVFELFGNYGCTVSTPTLTMSISLAGNVIGQGAGQCSASAISNNIWSFDHIYFGGYQAQVIGASGKIIGGDRCNLSPVTTVPLNATGVTNAPPQQVTIDTTAALIIDIMVTWNAANASNTFRLMGGAVYLDY